MSENKTTYCLKQSIIRTAIILISHALKWGPVYTHPLLFENEYFFSPFSKKSASSRCDFESCTAKRYFQKSPLGRAFLKRWVFGDRFQRIRVDGRPNRRKISPFSRVQCEHEYQVVSPEGRFARQQFAQAKSIRQIGICRSLRLKKGISMERQ